MQKQLCLLLAQVKSVSSFGLALTYLLCSVLLAPLPCQAADSRQLAILQPSPTEQGRQPSNIWDLPSSDQYILIAELETGVLRVFERQSNQYLQQIAQYPITIGKKGFGKTREGDERTPVGVYRITSQLTAAQLDDFYGVMAFPLNYPNVWDRLNQYSGSGIWLHGVKNDEIQRPLRDSDGCIVLANSDLKELSRYLNAGYTKVLGVPRIEWVSNDQIAIARKQLHERMQAWISAWESKNPDAYLAFYSKDFSDTEKNYQQWASYKRIVNTNKRFIKVNLSDVGLYAYPGQDNLAMAEFYQNYNSNQFASKGWKRQLWRLEADGKWRIIYEKGG